jgi:biopolymer transport protein ExbB/TolQ
VADDIGGKIFAVLLSTVLGLAGAIAALIAMFWISTQAVHLRWDYSFWSSIVAAILSGTAGFRLAFKRLYSGSR